ncbi:damage-control phosphatase ARMT1 family protein [Methanobrevibacter sp.]|uniref:damage-control phosphatase ARMT1 family protein n=1 Tax=Methanobrevibacter sp. TaxID=66852 RepID=UPI00386D5ABA
MGCGIIKSSYECAACILRQVKEVIDLSCSDEKLKFELMSDCINIMAKDFRDSQPNGLATVVNQYVKEKTGCEDPYSKQKEVSSEIALSLMPKVKEILKADDGLETYVKAAIVGNILDFGAYDVNTDFKALITNNLNENLSINDIEEFENALNSHDEVLYLVDNAGEIVFDRLLIEKMKEYDVNVVVAVISSPIVNDACMKEAVDAGLDELAYIITMGCDSGGIVEEMFSDDFRKVFDESRFIVSKGMANYEGLTEMDLDGKDVFSLLCSKCSPISRNLAIEVGSFVLKKL